MPCLYPLPAARLIHRTRETRLACAMCLTFALHAITFAVMARGWAGAGSEGSDMLNYLGGVLALLSVWATLAFIAFIAG